MKTISRILIHPLLIMGMVFILINGCRKDDTIQGNGSSVSDFDGNIYHTMTIGTQIWMVENLKTTHYSDGSPIPNISNNTAWANLATGAYCNYNNDTNNVITYGRLYNWFAISGSRNLAPTGWHIPTDSDWATLENYLGGESISGGKLKEVGTTHWQSPNTGATNLTGFTALPGGYRKYTGSFGYIGVYGDFWTSTEDPPLNALMQGMSYNYNYVNNFYYYKNGGYSVRCIKD